jgi:mycothiol system anti-sigma-R factor
VECRKFQEHITAAVDNALDQHEKTMLEAHLASCPQCKNALEIEKLTRNIVRTRCLRKHTPGHVIHRISEEIETATLARTWNFSWKFLLSSYYVRPAIGFAIAAIAVIVLLNNNSSINSPRVVEASLLPSNDVIKQSLANYVAFVKGEIRTQIASDKSDFVKDFFTGKTEFPVVVPTMSDCQLLGGVLNEYGGKTLAHVVYNHKSGIIYVYEACWETVQGGSPLHLAKDIQDELTTKGWFTTTSPDGHALVMWTNGNTLCAAVSKLDPETLKQCFEGAR